MAHFLAICDAEKKSGLGHYVRTQALTSELENLGHTVSWLFTLKLPNHIATQIKEKKQKIIFFDNYNDLFYNLRQISFDHLIVDSYLIPLDVRYKLRDFHKSPKIISIQDSPPYLHSDIYINQNFTDLGSNEYQLSDNTTLLAGEKFMMLDYKKYTPKTHYDSRALDKILIFFGGTSQRNLIKTVLRYLYHLNRNMEVEIFTLESDIKFLKHVVHYSSKVKVKVKIKPVSINQLIEYNTYDLCIGSYGMSAWERIYVGLPSIGVVIAENQRLVSKLLSEQSVMIQADEENLEAKVIELLNSAKLRFELFENSKRLLDGFSTRNLAIKLNSMLMR